MSVAGADTRAARTVTRAAPLTSARTSRPPRCSGKPSTQFSLIILYASLLGELVGKQLNVSRRGRIIKGPGLLLVGILVRFSVVLLYLLYLTQPLISGNNEYKVKIDGLVIAYLGESSAVVP